MAVLQRHKNTIYGLNASLTTLQQNIDNEVQNRIEADDTIANNLSAEITNRTNADDAIQSELDATQTGAGLNATGEYVANTSANYIDGATSLKDADNQLDTSLKAEEDARLALDAATLKKSANLSDIDDIAVARANIDVYSTLEVQQAITQARLNLGTNYSVATVDERDAIPAGQLAIGDNVFVADDGDGKWANYKVLTITDGAGSTSTYEKIMDEDVYLNAQSAPAVKQTYESNPDTNAFTDEAEDRVLRIGVSTTSLSTDDQTVFGAINELHSDNTTIQNELDSTQTGAGLNADGTYSANTSSNYIKTATSLKSADNALDSAIRALDDDTYSKAETDAAIKVGGAVFITESLTVSADSITLTHVAKNDVIFNFATVRYVDTNYVSYDIPVVPSAPGSKVLLLSPNSAGEFDGKNVTVQYAYVQA